MTKKVQITLEHILPIIYKFLKKYKFEKTAEQL